MGYSRLGLKFVLCEVETYSFKKNHNLSPKTFNDIKMYSKIYLKIFHYF